MKTTSTISGSSGSSLPAKPVTGRVQPLNPAAAGLTPDLPTLRENDLLVVRIEHRFPSYVGRRDYTEECRARVTRVVLADFDSSDPEECDSYEVEIYSVESGLVQFEKLTPGMFVRSATLLDMRDLPANTDWLHVAACAASYLTEAQGASDANDAILYMLRGKLHKYLPEAWLGGCDGLEAA